MTSDGEFRIDEDLVTCCGKMMLLDRLLPALISRGHKVSLSLIFSNNCDVTFAIKWNLVNVNTVKVKHLLHTNHFEIPIHYNTTAVRVKFLII